MQSNIQIRLNSNLPTLSDLKQQNEDLDKLGTSAEKVNKLSGKEQSPPVATKRPGSVPNDYASKQSRIENNQGCQAPTDVHSRLGPPLQNLSVPPPASQSTLAPLPLNQKNTLGPLTRIQPVSAVQLEPLPFDQEQKLSQHSDAQKSRFINPFHNAPVQAEINR